ncbi:MAG: histidine triad nucleotide-binding protein [Anaerolineae bacterium]|nr:histidine triad nucleotide-binding protein [Anaerolineae bacterium]
MSESPSIFTRIINGEIPGDFVYQDDQVVAIRDIHPQAPVHILIIPRKPFANVYELAQEDVPLVGHMLWVAKQIAQQQGIRNGFRIILNNGPDAGQEVHHIHMHLLAGEPLGGIRA